MRRPSVWSLATVLLLIPTVTFAQRSRSRRPQATPGHMVTLEFVIVDATGLDEEKTVDLAGDAKEIADRVRRLEREKAIDVVQRIRLSTLEDIPALVQIGQNDAVPTGQTFSGRGGRQTSYQSRQHGTIVQTTSRVDGDSAIVQLQIEQSRLGKTPKSDDDSFVPPRSLMAQSQATIRISDGQTVVAGAMQEGNGESSRQLLVLATAKIHRLKPAEPADLKIFMLKFADAANMAAVLGELFDDDRIKVSADARTNALIVSSNEEVLQVVEAVLQRLDVETE